MNAVLRTLALLAIGVAAAAQGQTPAVKGFVDKAKSNLVQTFKDPQSAQFQGLFISQYGDVRVLCGEVNGKNSYGGYVGFRRFAAAAAPGPKYVASSAGYAYDQAERMCESKTADVQ
jgi:hypothetical protein